ncbi:hypothetical protein AAVH_09609, partial [Aphelenchoides avenae]
MESEKRKQSEANHVLQARVNELDALTVRQAAENDDLKREIVAERTAFNVTATKLAAAEREVQRLKDQLTDATTQVETLKKEKAAGAEELRQMKSS